LFIGWKFSTEPSEAAAPLFKIVPEFAKIAAEKLSEGFHIARLPRTDAQGKPGALFRIQLLRWNSDKPTTVDVEVGQDRTVSAVTLTCFSDKGEKTLWQASSLPEEEKQFVVPSGVKVRDVNQLNPMGIIGQIVQMAGSLVSDATGIDKK
jgi:hypothetical protein